jgi:hypothetical protein
VKLFVIFIAFLELRAVTVSAEIAAELADFTAEIQGALLTRKNASYVARRYGIFIVILYLHDQILIIFPRLIVKTFTKSPVLLDG